MEQNNAIAPLQQQVTASTAPDDLKQKIITRLQQLDQLKGSPTFLTELDRISRYIEWVVSMPWKARTQDTLDLTQAKQILDKHHYGLEPLKDRVMEYMSIMKLTMEKGESLSRAPVLLFVGLVGTGKTTMAVAIAEALGRKLARIPFGGMGDPLDLRGQSRMHPEAEPGKIIKALREAQSRNPVILLDEIDRVTEEGRASIMGVLVELLDPRQNHAFVDHYIDYPFDLSEALFIATGNNTTNIATAVMDRLEPITMPSYNDQEKVVIGRQYLLPRALQEAGIPEGTITFTDDVWANLVRPLGFDAGIRTLERTIQAVVRKVARMMVEGKGQKFEINAQNVKEFIPQQ